MVIEFFTAFGSDASISLTPGGHGQIEVRLDGEKIYDRKGEDGKYPDLKRVREMKTLIQRRLDSV